VEEGVEGGHEEIPSRHPLAALSLGGDPDLCGRPGTAGGEGHRPERHSGGRTSACCRGPCRDLLAGVGQAGEAVRPRLRRDRRPCGAAARQWGEGLGVAGRSWLAAGDGRGGEGRDRWRRAGLVTVGLRWSSSSRAGSRRRDSRGHTCSPAAASRSPPFRWLAGVGTVWGAPPGGRAGGHVGAARIGLALQQRDQVGLKGPEAV
jgi:hypothetical protein